MQSQRPSRLIVIVTGANGGIGYGTCCRLIEQLSYFNPPDSTLLPSKAQNNLDSISPFAGTTELTLVVACRNPKSGHRTRELLFEYAKGVLQRRQERAEDATHAQKFIKGLQIDVLPLDLGDIDNIFNFAAEAHKKYPYISHLILNAGSISMIGVDWIGAVKQFISCGPIHAVTFPTFFIQKKSSVDKDRLNNVWKVNVFGHYCLYRKLEPLLKANPLEDSRVLWTTSLDAYKHTFDPEDVQALKTDKPYQPTKYQANLISKALSQSEVKGGEANVMHLSIHPGICSTNNTAVLLTILVYVKVLAFYIARWSGSFNHPINPFKGAVSGTVASLAPKKLLEEAIHDPPHSIGSRSDFWGKPYIGLDPWECDPDDAERLKRYFENVYTEFASTVCSPSTEDSGVAFS